MNVARISSHRRHQHRHHRLQQWKKRRQCAVTEHANIHDLDRRRRKTRFVVAAAASTGEERQRGGGGHSAGDESSSSGGGGGHDSDASGNDGGGGGGRGGFGMELPVLMLVPIAWGTWTPSTVLLYRNISHVPPPPLLNSYFQLVSFAALCTALVVTRQRRRRRQQQQQQQEEEEEEEEKREPCGKQYRNQEIASSSSSSSALSSQLLLRAGSELGAWLFVGSSLQLYGLQFTSAAKAPFLVQLTTIFVPVIESILLRRRLSSLTWIACLLGLVGVGVLSSGDFGALFEGLTSVIAPSSTQEILGDACCALSAVFFSIHVVRLGGFASNLPPVSLACVKAGTQVALCTITWAIGAVLGYWSLSPSLLEPATGASAAAVAPTAATLVVLGVVVWNGLVPSAFTVWAQSFGQRVVRPTTANLLYTLQPLWATLFAIVFLHERITLMTYIGGSLIVIASLIAVCTGQFAPVQSDDDKEEIKTA